MPMHIGDPMPPLEGATTWFNGSWEDVREKGRERPTLVHFWAVSCGVCKENMARLHELTTKFEPLGLQVISIHMPRCEADTGLDAITQVMEQNAVTEPTAVDNLHKLKDAFLNEQGWVPVYYLFDAEGKLRTRAMGEFGVAVLTTALDKMFASNAVQAGI